MVKITFQSVAGQKVQKENDGDKREILIPHAAVSGFLTRFISVIVLETSLLCVCPRPTRACAARISWVATPPFRRKENTHVSHCELGAPNVPLHAVQGGCGLSSIANGLPAAGCLPLNSE